MNLAEGEKIGIIGAAGRIGKGIIRYSETPENLIALQHIKPIVFPEGTAVEIRSSFDVTDRDSVDLMVNRLQYLGVRTIINSSGILTVDASEQSRGDYESPMWQTHVLGAENVAKACKKYKLGLIHLDTEYSFRGDKPFGETYGEDDIPDYDIDHSPTWYGVTHAQGAYRVLQWYPEHTTIVRVSQVQTETSGLFTATLRSIIQNKPFTRASDQLVSPITDITAANALAEIESALHDERQNIVSGKYIHIGAHTAYTSYDLSCMVADAFGLGEKARELISPKTLWELVHDTHEQQVLRPANSILSTSYFDTHFGNKDILSTAEEEIQQYKLFYGKQFTSN